MKYKKYILPIIIAGFVIWYIGGMIVRYKDAVNIENLPKSEQIEKRLEIARSQLPYEEDGQILLAIDYDAKSRKVIQTFKILKEALAEHNSTNTKENLQSDICSDEWIHEDIQDGISYEFKFINEKNELINTINIDNC